jgi:NAD(P)-dependent dehydrogenase (short-subunit alcohol dehydrogenase family)
VALVTGASRGVGASVALLLAQKGYDIVVNYHSKRARGEEVAEQVRALGRRALVSQADLTNDFAVASMIDAVEAEFGGLNILVLNAVRLVDLTLRLIPPGGRIVFVTSHLAHFYADRGMVGAYEPVAASKFAGEQALRRRQPEFDALGIGLAVVSGDLIEGTITPRLLERISRGTTQARREQVGSLPTVAEFARAIADAAVDANFAGRTVFVGSTD